jgi:membrane-bound lytic murein transglycosylase MltF
MLRLGCWAISLSLLLFCWASSSTADGFPRTYDDAIRASVHRYWGDYPVWLAWKAQLYQESRLDPAAVSPAGAAGLCQAMPATFRDWAQRNRWINADPHVARYCIIGGAQMMADLRRFFGDVPFPDRQFLAQAGYNAGPGNVRRARRLCRADDWAGVARCLPAVTGRHSAETITYVDRIARWQAMMEAGR